jgi:phosphatidylinositol glycan class H protein
MGPTTRFIPTTDVQDMFIHEGFLGFEARFYLAVVVKNEESVVVVFPVSRLHPACCLITDFSQHLLPGLSILEDVWRGARKCLYERKNAG